MQYREKFFCEHRWMRDAPLGAYGTTSLVKNVLEVTELSVSEGAEIVAVSNGDQTSNELNVTNKRSLYNGSALVILRAGRQAAKPVLTIEADGLKTVKTKLQTQEIR